MIVRTPRRRFGRSAFTLTEMLVVVAIILALAAIAVPITFSVLDSSKRDIAKAQITGQLVPAVMRYKLDTEVSEGNLPNDLNDLMNSPKAGITAGQLTDPWGAPYHFSAQSSHSNEFDIYSDGNGRQVGNWKD
jgi:general secretion pathway protein G